MLTGEYLTLWLTTYIVPFRRANTVGCYRRAIDSLPSLVTGCELDKLDPLHIQCALNTQAMQHPRAAQLTYTTLHVAFAQAVKLGRMSNNPVDACIKPIHDTKQAAVLDAWQLRAYVAAASQTHAYPLLLIMATCALRRSEALGLCWDDVDLPRGMIYIRHQRIRHDHRYDLQPLKSRSSCRCIPMPDQLQHELLLWRDRMPLRSLMGYVLDITPEQLSREHYAAIAAAQLPHVTLHGLRHSCAYLLAKSGTPIKLLQPMLGHSSYRMTADRYADHMQPADYASDITRLCSMVM